jgi:ABC-2 type transport system permease protein
MNPRHLAAMTAASTRELLRDRKTLFYAAFFPFAMLGLFLGVSALMPAQAAVDRSRFFVATGLFVALASVAFWGVAVPLVALRERGTLRLLSTTPVSRLTIMLAQTPARLAIAFVQVATIAAVSAAYGYLPTARLGNLLLTCLAGLMLLTPIGFLLGAILPTAESLSNSLTFLLLALLGMAGLFLPLDQMPAAVADTLHLLPPALLGEAIQHDLTGIPASRPAWANWLAAAGTGALLTMIATRTFRWDDSER